MLGGLLDKVAGIGGAMRRGSTLGVDIGTGAIRIVELSGKQSAPTLVNYGTLTRSVALLAMHDPAKTADSDKVESQVADHIRDLLRAMGTSQRRAVMLLPSAVATFKLLSFPKMKNADLHEAVLYQAERLVSLPLAEVVLDWEVVGQSDGDEEHPPAMDVLVAVVPREVVDRYVRIAKRSALNLAALEAEPFSLVRTANRLAQEKIYAVLDFGAYRSTLVIAEHGKVHQVTPIELTGSKLTVALAKSLVVDEARAEEMKQQYGLTSSGGTDLGRTLGPFLDGMVGEIRSGFNEFVTRTNNVVEALYLCGGGARLHGLDTYIARQFEVAITPLAALRNVQVPSAIEPHTSDVGVAYAAAIGLALRHSSEGRRHK